MKENNTKVLIVDDEEGMRFAISTMLKMEGYQITTADNGSDAITIVQNDSIDVVLMDIKMPGISGVEAMKKIKETDQTLPVILITAYGTIDTAVTAVKLGAYDYLTKPFDNEKVLIAVKNAVNERSLQNEINTLRANLKTRHSLPELMGSSKEIKKVFDQVNQVAPTNFTVVLYGETGSGKELVARAIHEQSPRCGKKFVAVDCGSIPETLIESEFFGHEKGAFTGAYNTKEGYFEMANKGTLFLDEIGNLPKSMQSKLLRAIEDKSIRRVGGNDNVNVDIRIIVAGNEKLEHLVRGRKFRRDLYHRLNEFSIEIPPLRNRKEDIIYLAKRFLDLTNLELNKNVKGLSSSAVEYLIDCSWPGNVRELRNIIRKAVLIADDAIGPELLSTTNTEHAKDSANSIAYQPFNTEMINDKDFSLKKIIKRNISSVERDVIREVLKRTNGNKSKAAKLLKIDYKTMHYKVKKYGIQLTIDI